MTTRWLEEMTGRVAETAGLDRTALALSPGAARALLEVARIASHASGERINAPLLCYVLGAAVARGADLDELARAVERFAGPAGQETAGSK